MEEMMGYVKYNWFHKEQHKPFKEDAFNQANFYYNRDDDYYVCPMGQHMDACDLCSSGFSAMLCFLCAASVCLPGIAPL